MTTTSSTERSIQAMDQDECWRRLRRTQMGRLAFEAEDRIAVLPLNFLVRGKNLVFQTSLDAEFLTDQRKPLTFEVDEWSAHEAWSVLLRGVLHSDLRSDPAMLTDVGFTPWPPDSRGPRDVVVHFEVAEVTGLAFARRRWQNPRWYW